jgi:hypothetical protein
MSDEFDKLEESIDSLFENKKKKKKTLLGIPINQDQDLRTIPIIDDSEIMHHVEHGYPLSELYFRQTGRTTRMLTFLAEEIRRTEVIPDEQHSVKIILLLGHSHRHCVDLIGKLYGILVTRGFNAGKEGVHRLKWTIRTARTLVISDEYRSNRDLEKHYGKRYDSVYIDPSCFDMQAKRIKEDLMTTQTSHHHGHPNTRYTTSHSFNSIIEERIEAERINSIIEERIEAERRMTLAEIFEEREERIRKPLSREQIAQILPTSF